MNAALYFPASDLSGTLKLTTGGDTQGKLGDELILVTCYDTASCPARDFVSKPGYTTLDDQGNFNTYLYATDQLSPRLIQMEGMIRPDTVRGFLTLSSERITGDFVAVRQGAGGSRGGATLRSPERPATSPRTIQ